MKPRIALKSTLKSIALGLALMLTTLCYGQANNQGAPHNVVYTNGSDTYGNDAFPELANTYYTDVIVNFLQVDTNCQLQLSGANAPPYVSPDDMLTLHNAGKTVLISFGNSPSEAYSACYYGGVENLASQIANFVYANGFDGVDIDFEDSSAFQQNGPYDGVQFLTQLTDDLYSQLSQPPFFEQNIITHAPQTPYWLDANTYNLHYPYPPYAQIYWNTNWGTVNEIAWFNNQTYSNCISGGWDCAAQDKINNYTNIVYSWQIPSIKLVVGVPVTPCGTTTGDPPVCTGDGYIPVFDDMFNVIYQLDQAFPNSFGGVMGWNFTLDSNQPDQGGSDTRSYDLGFALSAYEQSWVGWNAQTGLVLDSSNYSPGNGNVYTHSYNGGLSQNWRFSVNTIYNAQTLLCLDSNYAGQAYTDSCNGGNYQNWQFIGNTIVDRQTRRCLDSDYYGNVFTSPCNGNDSQNWNLPGQHP